MLEGGTRRWHDRTSSLHPSCVDFFPRHVIDGGSRGSLRHARQDSGGLDFPEDVRDRIGFDPQSKRLFFRGYMSKTEFDRLSQLTRDWSFRRKLEELFQMSVYEDEPQPKGARGLLSLFRKRAVPS